MSERAWPDHIVRAGPHREELTDDPKPHSHDEHIEPWLTSLFQAEHLSLLIGSGFSTGLAKAAGVPPLDMSGVTFDVGQAGAVDMAAQDDAETMGRGQANIEDQIRAALELIAGLRLLSRSPETGEDDPLTERAGPLLSAWESALDEVLAAFLSKILDMERGVKEALHGAGGSGTGDKIRWLLGGFLLSFASRTATRERLHLFTTNYDRLLEYACDLLGIRVLDRFVGTLAPVFQTSRLGIDLHYNPPGIRGEPRYLEGVVRLGKLHGSVDWRRAEGPAGRLDVMRRPLPFGASANHPEIPEQPREQLLIYPNPAKDVETLEYPYAELFRDFAAAACQPNSVVVTYGYGFGDSHVNRILRDMLNVPSTHLAIVSYDGARGRIQSFCERAARDEQITLLIGPHFGDLRNLVEYYLPKPAIDRTLWRMRDLQKRRIDPKPNAEALEGAGNGILTDTDPEHSDAVGDTP